MEHEIIGMIRLPQFLGSLLSNGIHQTAKIIMLTEVAELIGLSERLLSKKSKRSRLWKRKCRAALRAASRADLELRYKDDDDAGAFEGSLEDELDDEDQTRGLDLKQMLEEHLGRPVRKISRNSTDHSYLATEAKDRLVRLERLVRDNGSKDNADQLASIILRIEQLQT